MELTDIAILGVISAITSATFSLIFVTLSQHMRNWSVSRRLNVLEAEMDVFQKKFANIASQEAKANNKEEQAEFMAQAAVILKGEGEMKDKIQQVIALNPALALKMASKLGLPKLF